MKKFIKIALVVLFGSAMFFTSATAGNINIGQKIFGTKLKDACGMDGAKFAKLHTQPEWQAIYDKGKLETELKALCPKIENYNEKWNDHLFSFVYEYAKGSGNELTC